ALDGDAPNSPFATAFLKNLKVPKLDVRRLFDLVRDDVMETTGRRQQPFAYSSVSGREEFYFLTTPVGSTPTTPQISEPIVPGQQEILSKQEESVALKEPGTQAAPRVVLPAPVAPGQGAGAPPEPKKIRPVIIHPDASDVSGKPVTSQPAAAHDAPPPAATRPKITDRIEPSSPQSPAAPGTQAAVPAAQKVVLYEEDPA